MPRSPKSFVVFLLIGFAERSGFVTGEKDHTEFGSVKAPVAAPDQSR